MCEKAEPNWKSEKLFNGHVVMENSHFGKAGVMVMEKTRFIEDNIAIDQLFIRLTSKTAKNCATVVFHKVLEHFQCFLF